jgi:NTE family protein
VLELKAEGPSVGLALGGGFLRGAAHVGVLKVLVEEDIPIHAVAGTSSGSLAAAMFAAGFSPEKIKEKTLSLKPNHVYDGFEALLSLFLLVGKKIADMLHIPFPFRVPLGLMTGTRFERTVERMLGKQLYFRDLRKVCLAVTSVDLSNGAMVLFMPEVHEMYRSAKPTTIIPPEDVVIISDIPVSAAVRASTALPGLFEPKVVHGRLLTDGGVRDNVPVEVLKKMGFDVVLAVDVGYDGISIHRVDSIIQVLFQSMDIMASESILMKLDDYADCVIRPEIRNISVWDFDMLNYCIEQGEKMTRQMLPKIREIISHANF